ncbi:acrylyl-CoA reductase (NADPH) [Inquilinus ginsengisoli]|uniref:Acrylyl-CoA reductase (NADPH) n=1 Tax=Inquilinus ginsengisoli TaxID=363840 RepID=A0ABU1K0T8_9PROT|nr:MDR family oxidoreductase [Inquilinus ginsengisoli]MDR6294486.1 acrylyl-CoA reductase (NADPH) [Inquilinus ginsengisoli]
MSEFQALVLREAGEGKVESRVETVSDAALPEGDVTVAVEHSTLNYKDGMVLQGLGRLVRRYPHVPGVDFAGTVERSDTPRFKPGDKVILTGWRVGELHWGGYAQRAQVKADWLVPLPDGLTTEQAMIVGTAGFTAMLAVMALERHGLRPGDGEVLVTGAAGGVGSVATALLHRLGHRVVASTGRPAEHGYLTDLGAASIIDRAVLATSSARPLDSERWAGAIDAVGGTTLATLLTQLRHRASVAAVGNAGGIELKATVLPFLLRGVNLLGIDSVLSPREEREEAWHRIARELPLAKLAAMTRRARLADLPALGQQILQGGVRGRIVVDVNA